MVRTTHRFDFRGQSCRALEPVSVSLGYQQRPRVLDGLAALSPWPSLGGPLLRNRPCHSPSACLSEVPRKGKGSEHGSDRHAPDERRDKGAACEGDIPYPSARLGARPKLERDAVQNKAGQHEQERQIEPRERRRIDRRERAPPNDARNDNPGLVAVSYGRHRAQHGAAPSLVAGHAEQHADPEIRAVEQHVKDHSVIRNGTRARMAG